MLDELTGIVGEHFPVVGLTGFSGDVEVVQLCPVDDGGEGYLHSVVLCIRSWL